MRHTLQIPETGDADAETYGGVTYGELRDLEERILGLQGKLRRRDGKHPLLKIVTVDRIGIHFNPGDEYISHFGTKELTEVLLAYAEDVRKAIDIYAAA